MDKDLKRPSIFIIAILPNAEHRGFSHSPETLLELLLNNWGRLIYRHKTWLEMPRPSGDESDPGERDPLIAKFNCSSQLLTCIGAVTINTFEGPILYCFSSISLSCRWSNNTVFEMYCPKPICGPEFQLSKSHPGELYWEQAVSVPAPLNANELCLLTPALRATHLSQEKDAAYASASIR